MQDLQPIESFYTELNAAQDTFEAFAVNMYTKLYKELFAIVTAPKNYKHQYDQQHLIDCFLAILKPMQASLNEGDVIKPKEDMWMILQTMFLYYGQVDDKIVLPCEPYSEIKKSAIARINDVSLLAKTIDKIVADASESIYHLHEGVTAVNLPARRCFHSNKRKDPLICPDLTRAA